MKCRSCGGSHTHLFADLGYAPPSNAYLDASQLNLPETHHPLRAHICEECWLAQVDVDFNPTELFTSDYAYLSSSSDSWLEHARKFCLAIEQRLGLDQDSFVVEIACNDGYLLQNFVSTSIPILGIEPTHETANVARSKGIPVIEDFFGVELSRKILSAQGRASLIVGNNVLAHVPDINDFVEGCRQLLRPDGLVVFEFPHLMELLVNNQFDTIYHEHYSYLSLHAVTNLFKRHGLVVVDCEQLSTHGGSLRVFGQLVESASRPSSVVQQIMTYEEQAGLTRLTTYAEFQRRIDDVRDGLLSFLVQARRDGKRVFAYGAAAKGNTLLNFCGVRHGLIEAVFDRSKLKIGRYLPGSHIPIYDAESELLSEADYLLVLPWNLSEEIVHQLKEKVSSRCEFLVPLPKLQSVER